MSPPVRYRRLSTVKVLMMAADALWSNRLRTGLTTLGTIIGISSAIAITSIGQGVQKATEQKLQALGTNVLLVQAGVTTNNSSQGAATLTWEDSQAVSQQVTAAKAVSAFLQKPQVQVVYAEQKIVTNLIGTDKYYPEVKNIYPQEGQFLSQDDVNAANPVVVLGSKVRDRLFGLNASAVGADIRIQGERYKVIGVMEPKGALGEVDQDDQLYIPLTNMSARIVGNNALAGLAISGLWLKSNSEVYLDAAQFQVTNLLRLRHNIYPPQPDTFRITNQKDLINTLNSVVGLFTVMVVAIAGISLIVGGIGIANIMFVSVVERTREIGIRKAVGATNAAILHQFLAEAVVVSCTGGAIGVGVGIVISFGAATIFQFPFVVSLWSVATSLGISCVIGLLAGLIPAHHAAQLDPIVALRSE
ncbi:ABC transporter permease [Gloeocapsopsis crepidinum LEGE 06123]|uniref:ABC transporter permease n=1 Tax=Gloeocapsopsis crepidinum LEGE 06123 TaxID=588587 RepID=A0ABR9ULE4_9CHRO|nr:ABC transporter permease [Gloeocapsopsis crepidinum]MBE9189106.1 ABC transporter permease [Gloeocapsopsis crepidinum LEGE 06123]